MQAATVRASSPGRVTLLGEHTDYNEGCALAVATPWRTSVAATPADDGIATVRSDQLGEGRCTLGRTDGPAFAVLAAELARGAGLAGLRLDVTGDLPVGAGLSSSAAFAVATALSLGVAGDAMDVARVCQAAERAAGSDVGLLDQLVALSARRHHVVAIDFAVSSVTTFELADAIALSVVDTGIRRTVAASEYAARRAQCAAAARVIGPLGLASISQLTELEGSVERRRARHVITECARVRRGSELLASGDLSAFGAMLDEAHASLRDDFDASTAEVEAARARVAAVRGVRGARLVGAGFGGCLVVAHEPGSAVELPGLWSAPVVPGPGARLSSSS